MEPKTVCRIYRGTVPNDAQLVQSTSKTRYLVRPDSPAIPSASHLINTRKVEAPRTRPQSQRVSECPRRSTAKQRRTRKSNRPIPRRNQESLHWMNIHPQSIFVVLAKRPGNLPKRLRTFHLRLTLPVKSEALSANAAASLNYGLMALAQYLHLSPLASLLISPTGGSRPQLNRIPASQNRTFPAQVYPMFFRATPPYPNGIIDSHFQVSALSFKKKECILECTYATAACPLQFRPASAQKKPATLGFSPKWQAIESVSPIPYPYGFAFSSAPSVNNPRFSLFQTIAP